MTRDEADRVDLEDIAEVETGASGIRIVWKNGERLFVDGGAAARLLERWRRMKEAMMEVMDGGRDE